MSRLWHHVSIPAEVDGFVIPSPTWLPRFVHVIFHSLSLSLSLSFSLLFLLFPYFHGLSRDVSSPPCSPARSREGEIAFPSLTIFLSSSLLSLTLSFSSSLSSSPARLSLSLSRRKFPHLVPRQKPVVRADPRLKPDP